MFESPKVREFKVRKFEVREFEVFEFEVREFEVREFEVREFEFGSSKFRSLKFGLFGFVPILLKDHIISTTQIVIFPSFGYIFLKNCLIFWKIMWL